MLPSKPTNKETNNASPLDKLCDQVSSNIFKYAVPLSLSALIAVAGSLQTDKYFPSKNQEIIADTVSPDEKDQLIKLSAKNGITGIFKISSTPINMYEIISDKGVFYIDKNMNFVLNGEVMSLSTGENFTDKAYKYRASRLYQLDTSSQYTTLADFITNNEAKHSRTLNPNYAPISSTPTLHDGDISALGESLVKSVNQSNSTNGISEEEFYGTVEGLAEINRQKEELMNEIRSKYNVQKQQAEADGKVGIPKVGYDNSGNKLSEEHAAKEIAKFVGTVNESWSTVYRAENEKTMIVVFTSYTCGYCHRLHESIPELNKKGITVAYINFPRTGQAIEIENMKDAWCSVDQKAALNHLYKGEAIPSESCADLPEDIKKTRADEEAIKQHAFFGQVFNVKGTPTILTAGGKMISGFGGAASLINQVSDELK